MDITGAAHGYLALDLCESPSLAIGVALATEPWQVV